MIGNVHRDMNDSLQIFIDIENECEQILYELIVSIIKEKKGMKMN